MYSTTHAQETTSATPPACAIWCEEHEHGRFDEQCSTTEWVLTPAAHMEGDPGRLRVALRQAYDVPRPSSGWRTWAPVITLEADCLFDDGEIGRAGGDLTLSEARELILKISRLIDQAELGQALR